MYWVRGNNVVDIIPWFIAMLFCSLGGYLLASSIFYIKQREKPLVGFGLGIVLYLWLVNVVGHFLSPTLTFLLPSVLILIAGIFANRKGSKVKIRKQDLSGIVIQIGIFTTLLLFFTLIGRGLAIFDERKNLTLISLMANGDIPVHNPLNPDVLYQYHYGSQLLGASLVRLGSFFPWSAFDISKGIYWALSILLVYYFIRRQTQKEWKAILLTAIFPLLSGTRFLLRLLPNTFLSTLDNSIQLLGVSQDAGLPFSQALYADWVIGGGPPAGYPFGFLNGILKPMIMFHSGTETLAFIIILLLILLGKKKSRGIANLITAILLAQLALTWESTYALLAIAVVLIFIYNLITRKISNKPLHTPLLTAGLLSIPIVLMQGGTITEMASKVISSIFTSGPAELVAGQSSGLFQFNFPPVIFSGHLGGLSITDPGLLLVGLCELGPAIFFVPVLWKWVCKKDEPEKSLLLPIFISGLIGILIPGFFTYLSSERDITRFSSYGLIMLILLLLGYALQKGKTIWKNVILITCIVLMSVGGVVIAINQLSAIRQPILSEGIDGWDARISRQVWGKLETDALIFDPHSISWRAAVVSGNPTLLKSSAYSQEEVEELRNEPTINALLQYGFDYVYIDGHWWNSLDEEQKAQFQQTCIQEIASVENLEDGISRKVIKISECEN